MRQPFFDQNTLLAIESIFNKDKESHDLWGKGLSGIFADFYINFPSARYTAPSTHNVKEIYEREELPSIMKTMITRDSDFFNPEFYPSNEVVVYKKGKFESLLDIFLHWSRSNRNSLIAWIKSHNTPHNMITRNKQFVNYIHNLEVLQKSLQIQQFSSWLNVKESDLLWAFDNALRVFHYGIIAGNDELDLNHTLRNSLISNDSNVVSTSFSESKKNYIPIQDLISANIDHFTLDS